MQKIKYLDGLRGIAALIVVIDHFLMGFYPAFFSGQIVNVHTGSAIEVAISGTPLNILYDGNLSVCIFFVLSGYVLSYKFFVSKEYEVIVASAVKRYLRLMIPVLFSIFVSYLLMKLFLFKNVQASEITTSVWLGSFFNFRPNFLEMLKQSTYGVFFKQQTTYNANLWTMNNEFLGSFLVFAWIAFFGKLNKRYVFYLSAIFIFINTYYLAFILGMFISDLSVNNQKFISKVNNKYSVMIFIVFGFIFGSYPLRDVSNTIYRFVKFSNLPDPTIFYHILGACFFMLAVLGSNRLKYFLSTRPINFLGKISFSIYIMHLSVICSFASIIFQELIKHFTYSISFAITFSSSIIVILLISIFTYRYIDSNAIKISEYIYSKYFKYSNSIIDKKQDMYI